MLLGTYLLLPSSSAVWKAKETITKHGERPTRLERADSAEAVRSRSRQGLLVCEVMFK